MASTTRIPNGVTNANPQSVLGNIGQLDPTKYHTFFTDFDTYTAADWTVTETQAGATQALTPGDGGLLLLTNTAADNDMVSVQLANNSFVLNPAKAFFFTARVSVTDALDCSVLVGLVDIMTSFNPANGVYIFKNELEAPVRLSLEKGGVTTNSLASTGTSVAATNVFFNLGFSFDPRTQTVSGWVNNVTFASIADMTNLPTVALTPMVGVRNASAVARNLTVDYIFAATER